MNEPSSRDLHPQTGARFVFDRLASEPELTYTVAIYLPEARRWAGTLRWLDGRATLEPSDPAGDPDLGPEAKRRVSERAEAEPSTIRVRVDGVKRDPELEWAHAEALKLARVLHRDPKPHMIRWRGP
ncbi:MAG TPA: hypothetical protein VM869_21085 [Enhygromyxa sp.]|nr:hypothetical protein [Enhygromyxa sp.]